MPTTHTVGIEIQIYFHNNSYKIILKIDGKLSNLVLLLNYNDGIRPHVPGDLVCAIYRPQACFRELKQLLTTLKLKLNDCTTEFLVLMSPHQFRKYGLPDLQLGTVLIKPAVSVRNLGAHNG